MAAMNMNSTNLLDLPAELRVSICEHYFSGPDQKNKFLCDDVKIPERSQKLAIARVCRQLHVEAMPVFWSATTFCLYQPYQPFNAPSDERLYLWLKHIAKDSVKHIRHLEVANQRRCWLRQNPPNDRYRSSCKIEIDLNRTGLDQVVPQTIPGCRCASTCIAQVGRAVMNIPRVHEKPLVSEENIWNIYKSFYVSRKFAPAQKRTWLEFDRAYQRNLSKQHPREWSEDVWQDMQNELLGYDSSLNET